MNVSANSSSPLEAIDNLEVNRTHWRMVFTAGMGFFTDAYDLFIIGVVTAILAPLWHLTTVQLAVLNGASLAAAALGALLFGRAADKFGRKKMYGFEVVILFIGALISAAAPSFIWLLIARIVVGFGIGGDYPTSAVVISEYSGRSNRGYLVLLVFAMQALGLIVGPLLASALLAAHIPNDWLWRLLLGIGAIPAASVFYLRRKISETPRYLLSKETPFAVSRVISDLAGHEERLITQSFARQKLWNKKWIKCLVGTAGAWFLLDVAFYGNGVSSVLIMKTLNPANSLLQHTLVSALLFFCFAMPGYLLAAKYVDKIGRRFLQNFGFIVMAICYTMIALIPHVTEHLVLFLLIFGLSFFFVNFGPNTTTFLIPSEIYPTSIRASAHGLSAAIGKIGAFVGVFILPLVLKSQGLSFTIGMMAIVSLLGVAVTFLVPEMKNLSLETSEIIVDRSN